MTHFKKISWLLIVFTLIFSSLLTVSAESPSVEESEVTVELTPGLLTLDYVSSIHFGVKEIEGGSAIYESTTLDPKIQVSDRRGTGAGWTLTAKMSHFKNEESIDTLPGAAITFSNGEVESVGNPTSPPTISDTIKLDANGDAVTVSSAPVNAGLRTWIHRWLPSGDGALTDGRVTLEIPAGSGTIGKHKAIITWTLTDAPGQ